MASVQPPPPPSSSSSAPQPAPSPTTAEVVKAPPQLSQVKVGDGMEAKLLAQQPQADGQSAKGGGAGAQNAQAGGQGARAAAQPIPPGQVQVQTPVGTVTLQTHMPLSQGATLHLTLTSLKPPVFQIGLIDGKPVSATQTGQTAQLQPGQPVAPTPLAEGARIAATLLRPITVPAAVATPQSGQTPNATQTPQSQIVPSPQGSGQTQPQTPSSNAGTPTPTATPRGGPTVQAPSPQGGQPTSPPTTTTPTPQSTGTATAQGSVPQGSGQTVTLPTGTQLSFTVVRIVPPQGQAAQGAQPTGLGIGNPVTGIVTGTTAQGQPIVQTPQGTLALATRAPVPVGSQLMLKVETQPVIPDVPDSAKLGRAGPLESLVQSRTWPDMDEALKSLLQIDPSRLQHIAQNILPQSGAKLSNQVLFFLSALKGGDIKAWIGDGAARLIERDRPTIMSRISGDFQMMSRLADEPQSGDWRLALVPMWNGKEIEQLRMYYRGGGGEDGEDGDKEGTRFILDVDMSNLGHMQIDGLVKTDKKNLDLIVRSQFPLPDDWRAEIGELVQLAQEVVGLSGGVSFQSSPDAFIEFPPVDTPQQTPGLFV